VTNRSRRRHNSGDQDNVTGLHTLGSDLALNAELILPAGQPRTVEPLASRQSPRRAHSRVAPTADHDLALVRSAAGSRTDRGHQRQPQPLGVPCVRGDAHYPTSKHNRLFRLEHASGDRPCERKTGQAGQPDPTSLKLLGQPRPARKPVLARDHQLRRGQTHRRRIIINVLAHPLNRAGIPSARRHSQLLRQTAKLSDIRTLRQNPLRHAIPFVRAPGPRLEA
jgi:hypothetical protein